MAKLRETSVQNSLTLTKKDDGNTNDITISNNNGELNIDKNLKVEHDVSANSLTLPGGGITIDDTLDSDNDLVFSGIDIKKEALPNSIAETVQSSDYITLGKSIINIDKPPVFEVLLENDIINEGVDNRIFSNIEDIICESGDFYFLESGIAQTTKYTWVLEIEDAEGTTETVYVNVDLSGGEGSSTGKVKQYYKISIDKTKLGRATFKGRIKKISLSARSSKDSSLITIPVTDAEKYALNNVSIQIKLSMKRYNPNNILIGSYSDSFYKKYLVKTVGIGSGISPSNSYPLDIAAGGNHLMMDKDGCLSFGKVILNSKTAISDFTLANNELGLFVINFTTSDDLAATQYTAILSRVGRNTSDDIIINPLIGGIGGDINKNYSTFATDSGGYRIECTGDGKLKLRDSSGMEQNVCYLKKIIKIISY